MLTLLINLWDATDRLSTAQSMLAQEGFDFVRFEAVDGRGKPTESFPQYDPDKALRFYGRSLTSGEIGCYLSHLACVERFLESDAKYCLVLEDDMSLPLRAGDVLQDIVSVLEAHNDLRWEVINLGKAAHKFTTKIADIGDGQLSHAHYFPTTTTALLWSREGAVAFWETRNSLYAPVDHFLRRFCSVRGTGLCMIPALIVPTGAASMIDAEGQSDVLDPAQKARKRMRKSFIYFWKEFLRQSVNYIGALRSLLKIRLRRLWGSR